MNLDFYDDIPSVNTNSKMKNKHHANKNDNYSSKGEKCGKSTTNGIRVIKNNYKKGYINKNNNKNNSLIKIRCNKCDSELEITERDTHIGWLGAKYITCPCCGEESMVEELDGITLTKDNLKFPVHFLRTTKDLRDVVEVNSDEIIKDIKRAITYFRENKDEWNWYTSRGDLFLSVYRHPDDEEYFAIVTKDFYESYIPFEVEDYE